MATQSFKHAPCNEPLKISSLDPQPDDIVGCPKCGLTVSYEVFKAEIGEYFADDIAERMSKTFRDATRGNKFVTFSEKPRPKKVHRFVAELND